LIRFASLYKPLIAMLLLGCVVVERWLWPEPNDRCFDVELCGGRASVIAIPQSPVPPGVFEFATSIFHQPSGLRRLGGRAAPNFGRVTCGMRTGDRNIRCDRSITASEYTCVFVGLVRLLDLPHIRLVWSVTAYRPRHTYRDWLATRAGHAHRTKPMVPPSPHGLCSCRAAIVYPAVGPGLPWRGLFRVADFFFFFIGRSLGGRSLAISASMNVSRY